MKLTFIFCILMLFYLFLKCRNNKINVVSFDNSNCLKSAMAIAVVLHHLSQRTDILGFSTLFRDFGGIAVACFFFISGYGLLTSYKVKGKAYLSGFLSKRLKKLIIPFLLVIFIFQICRLFAPFDLIQDLRLGSTDHVLPFSWYIFCAILFYFIFYFAFKLTRNEYKGTALCWVFTIALMFFLRNIIHWPAYWWTSLYLFPLGLTYKLIEPYFCGKKYGYVCASFIFFCIFAVIIKLFDFQCFELWLIEFTLAALVFILPLTVITVNLGWLKRLSGISYEIYLVQGIIIYGLRSDYIYISNDVMYILLTIPLVLLLAFVVKRLLNVIVPSGK